MPFNLTLFNFKKIKKNRFHSFTLIELLTVIGIIAILSAVVVVASEPFRQQARDNQRKEALAIYQNALQQYYSDHKQYPINNQSCDVEGSCLATQVLTILQTENYLNSLPVDPLNTGDFQYRYANNSANNGKNYKLYVKLERDTEAMANDGGSDDLAYEVYSILGGQLAVIFPFIGTTSNLFCNVMSTETCTAQGGLNVLGLSAATNAHAELASETNYNYCVCCFSPPTLGIGNDCNASNKTIFLKLSAATNAHVEKEASGSAYSQSACISTSTLPITCTYREGSCNKGETTLCSISDNTNAHIGSPSNYNTKVCCKAGP